MSKKIVVAATCLLTLPAYSSEAFIRIGASQVAYETDLTSGGRMTVIDGSIETENKSGQFHKLRLAGAVEAKSTPGHDSDRYVSGEYNIGKYWYPRASARDYSISAGLGQWELTDHTGIIGAVERKVRALYLPINFEGSTPITRSGTYFVYGLSVQFVVDGTVELPSETFSDRGGYGYSAWAGFDFRLSDTSFIETRLGTSTRRIDISEYELQENNLSISLRF